MKHQDITKQRDHISMECFNCDGWLKINVNPQNYVSSIELTHRYHNEYMDVRVSEEIKDYIMENIRQTPRLLWEELAPRSSTLTEKQLYRWWMEFSQHSWKRDEDQVESTVKLIEEYVSVDLMFKLNQNGVIGIAFAIKDLLNLVGNTAIEIAMDATCKLSFILM